MSDLLELVSLQAIDDGLDQARGRLAAIEQELSGNEEIDALRERLAAAESALEELRKRQRASDGALQDIDDRIAREEKKLYDGSIVQFKELQALEGDIEHLKAERRTLEDAGLEILTELETATAEQQALESELERLTADWGEASAHLSEEAAGLRSEIAAAEASRERQLEQISAGAVRLYEGLRKRKAGKAVVRVQGNSCSGCRVAIPDPVRRRIVSSPTLVQCPHCERILALG